MKKVITAILAIVMVFSLMPSFAVTAATEIQLGENLLANGGYETLDWLGRPTGIGASGGWNTAGYSVQRTDVHSGNYAAKIDVHSGVHAYTDFYVSDLLPSAKYEISFWYKGTFASGTGLGMQIEQYSNNRVSTETLVSLTGASKYYSTNTWTQVTHEFELLSTANMIHIAIGSYPADCTYYVDDISFKMTKGPEKFVIDADVFYYTDWEVGEADLLIQSPYTDEGYSVEFELMDTDGETVLKTAESTFTDDKATFEFDLDLLSQKKTQYMLYATIYDSLGAEIDTVSEEVYKYDRPTRMKEDGSFVDENGDPFYPVKACSGVPRAHYRDLVANGVNVVAWTFKDDPMLDVQDLDQLHAMGLKVAVVCFWDMYPAGNEINVSRVSAAIKRVRNHPAIFCWSVADEPFAHDSNAAGDLRNSYKMIRELDDKHPITFVESIAEKYHESAKYADLLSIDPYPGNGYSYATHVGDMSARASKESGYKKPIENYLQAWDWVQPINATQFHSTIHQGFLGGTTTMGYYAVPGDPEHENYFEEEIWQEIKNFAAYEQDIMFAHFSKGNERPSFNRYRGDEAWYEVWEADGVYYASVQNRQTSANTVSVSLVNDKGTAEIIEYDIEVVNGGNISDVTKAGGLFTVNMAAYQAVLYKITPIRVVENLYTYSDNILPAGDFEAENHGWTIFNVWDRQDAAKQPVVKTQPANSYFQSTVGCGYIFDEVWGLETSGTPTYLFEFDYQLAADTRSTANFMYSHDGWAYTTVESGDLPASPNGWTHYSREITLNNDNGNRKGTCMLRFYNQGGNLFRVDNISVRKVNGDGTYGTNIIENGDFEAADDSNWEMFNVWNGNDPEVQPIIATENANKYFMSTEPCGYATIEKHGLDTAKDEAAYMIEFDYQLAEGSQATAGFNYLYHDANGNSAWRNLSLSGGDLAASPDGWTHFSNILTVDNSLGARNGLFSLQFYNQGGVMFKLDNVSVREITGYDMENMIANPGFELGTDKASPGWVIHKLGEDAAKPVKSGESLEGEFAVYQKGWGGQIYQNIPIPAGTTGHYLLEYDYKQNEAGHIWCNVFDDAATKVTYTDKLEKAVSDEWTRAKHIISLDNFAGTVLRVVITGRASATGEFYIDNFSLKPIDGTSLQILGEDGEQVTALSATGETLTAKTVYAGEEDAILVLAKYETGANGIKALKEISAVNVDDNSGAEAVLENVKAGNGVEVRAILITKGMQPVADITIK